jgi:hypothetical protein
VSAPDERPTIPAPACPLEQAFEEDIARRGGSWSEKRKAAKPMGEEKR